MNLKLEQKNLGSILNIVHRFIYDFTFKVLKLDREINQTFPVNLNFFDQGRGGGILCDDWWPD